jgi:hypothetical protein
MNKQTSHTNEQNVSPQRNIANPADAAKNKKAYEKPRVIYHAPLEAMAATCSSFPGKSQGICGVGFS